MAEGNASLLPLISQDEPDRWINGRVRAVAILDETRANADSGSGVLAAGSVWGFRQNPLEMPEKSRN